MAAMNVSAQSIQLNVSAEKTIDPAIEYFLNTEVGKRFTQQQVLDAMQQPSVTVNKAKAETVVLMHETFDKWTAGSNETPDTQIIEADDQAAVDALCDVPGWTAFYCSQAGGAVYESFDEVGDNGPGYLMVPDFDMSQNQGVFRFKARVMNVNPNATTASLQYFALDNNPEHQAMLFANVLPMTYGEWTEVEFEARVTSAYTTVMFYSWSGKVLVDEVTIEQVNYELATPANIAFEAVSGTEVKFWCDPVEGATSYLWEAYSRNAEDKVFTAETAEPTVVLAGQFKATEDVIVKVIAQNEVGQSYPGVTYGGIGYEGVIDAPVALEATNVSNDGFTANWEPSFWANSYALSLTRSHSFGEGENLYYMQEDFSEVEYTMDDTESTVMTQTGLPVSLNDRINAQGWNTYLAVVAQGMLGLTNMYEMYGFPGLLVSDPMNFSYGEGKVKISGMAMSMVDDVVMKVGFAEAHASMFGTTYTFLEGAQEFEITPAGSIFEVEIEGGTENSILLLQMVDASPEGEMVLFAALSMETEAAAGEQYTAPYGTVNVSGLETSYNLVVDFPAGDSFTYSVVGKFGQNASAASEVVGVEAPGAVSIDRTEVHNKMAEFFTLDGRRVKASDMNELQDGTYIMRSNAGSAKIMK